MAAFGSLTASDIVPVEDFGLMMCMGVLFALLIAFTLFPAVLMLLPRGAPKEGRLLSTGLVAGLSRLAVQRSGAVGAVAAAALALTAVGVAQLSVDNRFIDYFKDDTDINRGMVYIDRHLGGTAPFDVVLDFEPWQASADGFFDDLEDGDLFADEAEADSFPERLLVHPRQARPNWGGASLHRSPSGGRQGGVAGIAG